MERASCSQSTMKFGGPEMFLMLSNVQLSVVIRSMDASRLAVAVHSSTIAATAVTKSRISITVNPVGVHHTMGAIPIHKARTDEEASSAGGHATTISLEPTAMTQIGLNGTRTHLTNSTSI